MYAFQPSAASYGSADFTARAQVAMQAAAGQAKAGRAQRRRAAQAAEAPAPSAGAPPAPPALPAPPAGPSPSAEWPAWAMPVLVGAGIFLVGTLVLLAVTRPAVEAPR